MGRKVIAVLFFLTVLFSPVFGIAADMPKIKGFAEFGFGAKLSDDTTKRDDYNFFEQRLQLKSKYIIRGDNYFADKGSILNFRGDFTVDEYYPGKTSFELREMNLSFTPWDIVDMKIGRQVLTWGTGDYLFINDMFPKDYVSFFLGRDDEYLKKPSDAIKMSIYPSKFSMDFIVIPYFTPNTHAQGDRLSFFDSFQGGIAGTESDRHIISPPFQMSNNEYALRAYRNFGSNEVALYFFRGFDKSPRSYKDELNRQLYYERVDVYGSSIRGPFLRGIGNAEIGYVNSREDSSGTNRMIANSMFKAMLGYSENLANNLTLGFQYYYEQILDYDNYRDNLLAQDYRWDEFRHVLTNRITKTYKKDTVMLSLFTFYSPSDRDGYVRPSVSYDISDQWQVTFGANLPWGEDDITEFGQMKRNKNIFTRVRYNF